MHWDGWDLCSLGKRSRVGGAGVLEDGEKVRKRRNSAQSPGLPCHSVTLRCQSSFFPLPGKFTEPSPSGPLGRTPLKSAGQPGNKPGPGRHLLSTCLLSCTLG